MAKLGFILAVFIVGECLSATANGLGRGTVVGGRTKVKDVENNKEIQSLGSYSVDEYNKQQQGKSGYGGSLKFKKVIEAETQVVSGIKYYLKIATLTADGTPKIYYAEVVVKAWAHSKELLSFSPSPSR